MPYNNPAYQEQFGMAQNAARNYTARSRDFDASKAVNRYARGAWGSISEMLGQQLEDLEGSSVGAGRFDSGLYDRDQGVLWNRATGQLNDAIAQQSLGAAGLDLRNIEGIGSYGQNAFDMTTARMEQEENDRREREERKRRSRGGIGAAIGGVLGAGAGTLIGGPAGTAIGERLGSGLGGFIGGR